MVVVFSKIDCCSDGGLTVAVVGSMFRWNDIWLMLVAVGPKLYGSEEWLLIVDGELSKFSWNDGWLLVAHSPKFGWNDV